MGTFLRTNVWNAKLLGCKIDRKQGCIRGAMPFIIMPLSTTPLSIMKLDKKCSNAEWHLF